jgi:hypothetical protein
LGYRQPTARKGGQDNQSSHGIKLSTSRCERTSGNCENFHAFRDFSLSRFAQPGSSLLARNCSGKANAVPSRQTDLIALEEALVNLAKLDERKCRLVELRYFGGLIPKKSPR